MWPGWDFGVVLVIVTIYMQEFFLCLDYRGFCLDLSMKSLLWSCFDFQYTCTPPQKRCGIHPFSFSEAYGQRVCHSLELLSTYMSWNTECCGLHLFIGPDKTRTGACPHLGQVVDVQNNIRWIMNLAIAFVILKQNNLHVIRVNPKEPFPTK